MRGTSAVIFDMDGVLVDSEPVNYEAMRRVLARYGIPFSQIDNAQFLGMNDLEIFRALKVRHRLEPAEDELIRQQTEVLVRLVRERSVPRPGIPDVPQRLCAAGYRLALASSAVREVIAETLGVLGVAGLFERVVSGMEVGNGKPAPDIFLEAARRLAVPPENCLVVEDSYNGILAAKAAGMLCVAIPCAATHHQDFSKADFRLEGLPDLLRLMEEIRADGPVRLRKKWR